MSEEPTAPQRRRRRRATSVQGAPAPHETPLPGPPPVAKQPVATPPAPPPVAKQPGAKPPATEASPRSGRGKPRPRPQGENTERGLRDVVGAGHSQLGVSGALRGRDVNRPTEADLAEAEQTLVIVRRHWQPADTK